MFDKNTSMHYKIKKNVKITHLAYADDILIFLNASKKNLHIFKNCLTNYENVSGQKINSFKSNFIMYNPTVQVANWVQRISGFNKAELPIMYLGVPLWKGFQSFEMFGPLLSKIKNKLLTWNHHLLSTGGRLELIKLVLNSIAIYILQVVKPPENVIIALERLFNKFLWGTNDNRRRLHWAAWSRLCYPTGEGGFGCRDLHDIIRAGEIKMWWRFRTSNNIWSNFLMKKYCSRLHPKIIKLNPKSSHIWKNLCEVREFANGKIVWHTGNGKVSFWHDCWCDMSPKINRKLPDGICDHICSFPISLSGVHPSWALSPNGVFDFKTTWNFIRKNKPTDTILRLCWNPIVTPTISVVMVKIFHGWIPTPDGLARRGIIATNSCYCCNGVEILPHLFINGPIAKEVWKIFHNLSGIKYLISTNFRFVFANWFGKAKGKTHIFHIIPILICWFLWCCRNDKRVDNVPFTAIRVCDRIWKFIHSINLKGKIRRIFWKGADKIAFVAGITLVPRPIYSMVAVRWIKPRLGWWKLNTDGAALGSPGDAAAGGGGVIRDHLGHPLLMFSEFLGVQTNNYVGYICDLERA
ncbi:hypothetical protein OROMI_014685 [Orobanche minor]